VSGNRSGGVVVPWYLRRQLAIIRACDSFSKAFDRRASRRTGSCGVPRRKLSRTGSRRYARLAGVQGDYREKHLSGWWPATTLPGSAGTFVCDVSASSATNVWAALANEPDVARLTTHGWVLRSFTQGSLQVLIAAVLTFSPGDTWVFYTALNNTLGTSAGYAVHYNGSAWHTTALPAVV
jgi:hypothetical protein